MRRPRPRLLRAPVVATAWLLTMAVASAPAATTAEIAAGEPSAAPLVLPHADEPARLAQKTTAPKVLRSKGYRGTTTVPTNKAPDPPTPAVIGDGHAPSFVLDAAGTAHIVWNQARVGADPDVTHYCRLPRGASTCANPNPTPMPINVPYAADVGGPKIVQVADQLVVLTHRHPPLALHPDGETRDRTTYAWTSTDGGDTWTGPGIVGTVMPSAAALVGGAEPRIAVLTDRFSAGPRVQLIDTGAFTAPFTQLGDQTTGTDSAIAPDGNGVLAAFSPIAPAAIELRHLPTAAGASTDPAGWGQAVVGGQQAALAGGPAGPVLLAREGEQWTVRTVAGAQPGPSRAVTGATGGAAALAQGPGGRLHVGAVARGGAGQVLQTRTSDDLGQTWSSPFDLATAGSLQDVRMAALADGGGVAISRRDAATFAGPIVASAFGTLSPTGQPGAGARAGGGIPGGYIGCLGAGFEQLRVEPKGGCLLQSTDPKRPSAVVSRSEVDFNGLILIPDAGVSIMFDPRERTLDTTGKVKIVLRLARGGDIPLVHTELHVRLKGKSGESLFSGLKLPAGPNIKGFPIDAEFDIKVDGDGVKIPVSLKLPKALGSLSAEATLAAQRGRGAILESFRATLAELPLGAFDLAELSVDYQGRTERWDGNVKLRLPLGRVDATIGFEAGRFVGATLRLGLRPPGVPVFKGVWFTGLSGGLGLDPFSVEAGASLGFVAWIPGADVFTADLTGQVKVTVRRGAMEFQYDGSARVMGVQVGSQQLVLNTRPAARFTTDFGYDLGLVSAKGGMDGFFDGPTGTFGAAGQLELKALGVPVKRAEAVFSSRGVGACAKGFLTVPMPPPLLPLVVPAPLAISVGKAWAGDGHFSVGTECEVAQYRVAPPVTGAAARRLQAGGGQAVRLSEGRPVNLEVVGAGRGPDVDLITPAGRRITPTTDAKGGKDAVRAFNLGDSGKTIIYLPRPRTGTWQVVPRAGSTAVQSVRVGVLRGAPTVRATVVRRGSGHLVRYRADVAKGLRLRLVESGRDGGRSLGQLRRGNGTLVIPPGGGPGGRRELRVIPEGADVPSAPIRLGSYRASGPVRLAAPRQIRRQGTSRAVWRAVPGARRYVVSATLASGRTVGLTTRRASVKVPGAGRANAITAATVTPIDTERRAGRTGRMERR